MGDVCSLPGAAIAASPCSPSRRSCWCPVGAASFAWMACAVIIHVTSVSCGASGCPHVAAVNHHFELSAGGRPKVIVSLLDPLDSLRAPVAFRPP